MKEKIKNYIDSAFRGVKETQKMQELKEELYANLLEKYNDNLAYGKTEMESYTSAVASIGDISELIEYVEPQNISILGYLDDDLSSETETIHFELKEKGKKDFFEKAKSFFISKPQNFEDEYDDEPEIQLGAAAQKESHILYVIIGSIFFALYSFTLMIGDKNSSFVPFWFLGSAVLVFANVSYRAVREENKEKAMLYYIINTLFAILPLISASNTTLANKFITCMLIGISLVAYNKMLDMQYENSRVKSAIMNTMAAIFFGAGLITLFNFTGYSYFEGSIIMSVYAMSLLILVNLLNFKETPYRTLKAIGTGFALYLLLSCSAFSFKYVNVNDINGIVHGQAVYGSDSYLITLMCVLIVITIMVIYMRDQRINPDNVAKTVLWSFLYIIAMLMFREELFWNLGLVELIVPYKAVLMPSIAAVSLFVYYGKLRKERMKPDANHQDTYKKAFKAFLTCYLWLAGVASLCFGLIFIVPMVLFILMYLVITNFYGLVKENGFRG